MLTHVTKSVSMYNHKKANKHQFTIDVPSCLQLDGDIFSDFLFPRIGDSGNTSLHMLRC